MNDPVVAQKSPYEIQLKAGQDYYWCTCGRSAKQPLCDGSHKVTDFKPLKFQVPEEQTAYLCGCKHSKNMPFCDGAHKSL